ncbi:MAG: hypothetical protein HKN32_03510, partial [Flavobacteriales bacterium]|nr:hypothetical protein [Flavobacteriales bacterium]
MHWICRISLFALILLWTCPALAQLKVNEFSAHKGTQDLDGEEHDWIELINYSSQVINLGDYTITDNPNNPTKWALPSETVNPMELIPIFASSLDRSYRARHWETIVMDSDIWKYFPGTEDPGIGWTSPAFNDSSWDEGPGGFGFGDDDDGTVVTDVVSIFMRNQFTVEDINDINLMSFHADFDDGFIAYLNGVEIARENLEPFAPDYNDPASGSHESQLYQGGIPNTYAWVKDDLEDLLLQGSNTLAIQLHNSSAFSADMTGRFFLSVGMNTDNITYQETPEWFNLGPSAYHSNFKLSPGEGVYLFDSDQNLVDQIEVSELLSTGISHGRSPDGTNNWCYFDSPSFGSYNEASVCYAEIEPIPGVSLESGWYQGMQTVGAVSSSPTQLIRYTTNGDLPTESSPLYTQPLTVDNTSVLSFRAFSTANNLPSPVVDRTYFIGEENYQVSTLSIITDSLNLWDWNTGIYVYGPNADTQNYPYFGSNFWEPWSKWSRLEYFDEGQNKIAEEQFDLEIHGGWSRAEAQKSFRIDLKSKYTGRLEHPLISHKPWVTDYNNFNLRAGGQHVWTSKIQDAFFNRLIKDTHTDRMGYEPCVMYMNGDFWGLYGIREKIDETYLESNHNVDPDALDLLNGFGVLAGNDETYYSDFEAILGIPASSGLFYDQANAKIDLKAYKDYFIAETYFQNVDWLGLAWGVNNVKLWRPHETGARWRYVLYDTDGGFGAFFWNPWQNYIDYAQDPGVPNLHSDLFTHMLQNEQFKCEFINRYADLCNTIFTQENFDDVLWGMQDDIDAAMPDNIATWGMSTYQAWIDALSALSDYNDVRLNSARSHLNTSFALDGQVDVTLNVVPENAGRIHISTISPDQYPWEGVYFDGCPVTITAIANPGYSFDHWEMNDLLAGLENDQSVTLNISQDDLFEAVFTPNNSSLDLRLSEINYHSHDDLNSGKWIELHNSSSQSLDIGTWTMGNGTGQLEFEIPASTSIPAGGRLVVVNDEELFTAIHSDVENYIGEFSFPLSNSGDQILLKDSWGNTVLSANYNDNAEWPQGADGMGRTLELTNPSNYDAPDSWKDGCMGGSPGAGY